ncbi:hypothetical protein [Nocardioides sp. Root190]|uniref:hypothetical protein n=1 Tax=Nocardioides sp. Root190 TaxID=1736488 RepID=UPI000A8A9814|nr:hypothetical protein [Nocardioides sp. Root190]
MTQHVQGPGDGDRAMVHHFIRQVGRAPTDDELVHLRGVPTWLPTGLGARVRRRAARLIGRW